MHPSSLDWGSIPDNGEPAVLALLVLPRDRLSPSRGWDLELLDWGSRLAFVTSSASQFVQLPTPPPIPCSESRTASE